MKQENWRQPVRFFVVGSIFLAFIWLFVTLQPLIGSLLIAALIAYILHPLVNIISNRTGLSRNGAVSIVYLIFILMLIAIPAILTPIVISEARDISPDLRELGGQIRHLAEQPLTIGTFTLSVNTVLISLEDSIAQTATGLAGNVGGVVGGISTNFLWVLIILVSIYYLLKDSQLLLNWAIQQVAKPFRHHAEGLLAEIDAVWGEYLRGQLLLMLIVGILSWIGGAAVGLPGAFVIGFLAGVLDIIPSLGPTLAAIIAMAVALLQGSNYLPVSNVIFAVIVLAIFIVIQQIENIWIRPALMGRRLKLHPALVFIGVFSSLALFGILVTLFIIPVLATVGVIGRYIYCLFRGVDPFPTLKEPLSGTSSQVEDPAK